MIRVENLSKRFGETQAVKGVSFNLAPGQIYGLLGPNGAGKTTTISMLSGLLAPDSGKILFQDQDIASDRSNYRRRLGVVPQELALYDQLSARENLRFWAGLYDLKGAALAARVETMLERVGLEQRADSLVKSYSGGMKRRLNLALGLVHAPAVLLLDEPTVGIDPQGRARILEIVQEVAAAGTAVLYTTHYLEEAETLCDRIGIIDSGALLTEGSIAELKSQVGNRERVTIRGRFDEAQGQAVADGIHGAHLLSVEQGRVTLTAGESCSAVEILSSILEGPLPVDGVTIEPPSLQTLFLELTGRELRD
jgi:ABC-2 type transport system ATP-binding protein